jgi:hypothetical protein
MGTEFMQKLAPTLQSLVPQQGAPVAPSVGTSNKWVDAHGNLVPGPQAPPPTVAAQLGGSF